MSDSALKSAQKNQNEEKNRERSRRIRAVVEPNCRAFADHIKTVHGDISVKSPVTPAEGADQWTQFSLALWPRNTHFCVAFPPNLGGIVVRSGQPLKKSYEGNDLGVMAKVNHLLRDIPSGKRGGFTDDDCATDYLMIEMDHASFDAQLTFWNAAIFAGFPVITMVSSGGKSIHVIIRIAAESKEDYKAKAVRLMKMLEPFRPDPQNTNPSRFTRIPGVSRLVKDPNGGSGKVKRQQELLYLNPNAGVWREDSGVAGDFRLFAATAIPFSPELRVKLTEKDRERPQEESEEAKLRDAEFMRRVNRLDIPFGLDLPSLLDDLGLLHDTVSGEKETKFFCECPWSCDHSGSGDDDGDRDAYFYDRGTQSRMPFGFFCSHSTCLENGRDILGALEMFKDDYPEVWEDHRTPPPDYTVLLDQLEPDIPKHEAGLILDPDLFSGPADETGNSRIFCAYFHNRAKYLHDCKTWVTWSGDGWEMDHTGLALKMAEMVATLRMGACADAEERPKLRRHANLKARKATLELSASEPGMGALHKSFDSNLHLLGVANGVLDLRTCTFRPAVPEDMLLRKASSEWRPSPCPRWERFMAETHPDDPSAADFLKRWAGYCLSASIREHKLLILYGTGRNGKSTFVNTIREILGDYGFQAPCAFMTENLKSEDSGRANSALMATRQRRLTCIQETGETGFLNEQFVKMLVSGDPISGRELYGRAEQFLPTSKFILSTNHKPRVKGSDIGIWSKIILCPFSACFEANPDRELDETLRKERPGILQWMLEGYREWMEWGLRVPESLQEATAAYRQDEDILGEFIESELIVDLESAEKTDMASVYSAYVNWCSTNNQQKLTVIRFNKKLDDRGFVRSKSNGEKWWIGVKFRKTDIG